jgi:hypothetical protein
MLNQARLENYLILTVVSRREEVFVIVDIKGVVVRFLAGP